LKLNQCHIDQLYTFTQKHYVEYYDVQTELVDHLANGIEAQWQDNPQISFDEALKREFKKFGITGFSDILQQKIRALNKHYRIRFWHFFKQYFKFPKILLILILIWAYHNLLMLSPNRFWIVVPTAIIFILLPIHYFSKAHKKVRQREKITGKKWLFDVVASQLVGVNLIWQVVLQVMFFDLKAWSDTFNRIFAVLIVLFAVGLYVCLFKVSKKLTQDMEALYPDYEIT
jgi:hypothetical protein